MSVIYAVTFMGEVRFPRSGRRAFVTGHRQVHCRKARDPKVLARIRAESKAWLDEIMGCTPPRDGGGRL